MWITSPSSSPDLRYTNTRNPETIKSQVLYKVIWEEDGHQRSHGWTIVSPFITTLCHITWSTNRPLCYTYWFWTTSHSLFWLRAILSFSIKMQPVYYSRCILMWAGRNQHALQTGHSFNIEAAIFFSLKPLAKYICTKYLHLVSCCLVKSCYFCRGGF